MFSYNNYSPTASVDGESLFSRQALTQSAVHTPSRLDELLTSVQLDPLSQSMRAESGGRNHSSTKSLGHERTSFRSKLGRLFGGLFRREDEEEPTDHSEDYIELFLNDSILQRGRRAASASSGGQRSSEGPREMSLVVRDMEASPKPQETMAVEIEGRSSHPVLKGDVEDSDSPVNNHRQSGLEGVGQLGALGGIDIDISTLPVSNRASRSDSESSQESAHHFQFRDANDSPNTAGAGRFKVPDVGHSYKEVGASATCENPRISSSYPRRSVSRVSEADKVRTHTSNSETEVNSRALQLQEKLQRLVEHKEPRGSAESSPEGSILDSNTPVMENSGQVMDNTGILNLHTSGHTHGNNTRLTMRRVSVCSRRGIGLRFTSESSSGMSGTGGTVTGGSQSDPQEPMSLVQLSGHPSPLALLDQFVSCGEVLHRGSLHSIPLTEQEGVDWNHFGGCPHSEEFRIMQSQVVLLHSQLLFERHQCVQHAKRNRRLLSKARSAAHVTEELVSLVSEEGGGRGRRER